MLCTCLVLLHRGTHCSPGPRDHMACRPRQLLRGKQTPSSGPLPGSRRLSPGHRAQDEVHTRGPFPRAAACLTSNPDTTRVTAGFVPVAAHLEVKTGHKWDPLPTLSQRLYLPSWSSELQSRVISQNQGKEPQDLKDNHAKLVHLGIIINDPLLVYM